MDNGTIAIEAQRVMDNVEAVLGTVGCSFADAVMVRIGLKDYSNFPEVNKVYARNIASCSPPPCRRADMAGPPLANANVEMDVEAVMSRRQWLRFMGKRAANACKNVISRREAPTPVNEDKEALLPVDA